MELIESVLTRNIPYLSGGILIGLAASGLLWLNGRIAGVSGIIGGLLDTKPQGVQWRVLFLLGLLGGGFIARTYFPEPIGLPPANRPLWVLASAGLLIGLGTGWAQGCTSGHGICGIARLSPRSLIATISFMGAGILTATLYGHFGTPL